MLKLVPKHWFSWEFRLVDPVGMPWGEIALSSWRDRGSIAVGNQQYRVSRQGLLGPFVLEGPRGELAKAVKRSAFRQEFALAVEGREYTIKRLSAWRREVTLLNGDVRMGSVAPGSWFTRRADVMLPEDMPAWVRAFVVWLTLLMWKRDSNVAAAGS